jgi:acyl-CoA thioesterase-1
MRNLFTIILLLLLIGGGAYYVYMITTKRTATASRATPVKIVAFGDSLTAGYGVPEEDSYPSQLARALSQYPITMVNLGVSGDTTQDALARVEQVIDEKPDIVLLGIGGNDALRTLPVDQAKANIESILQTLRSQPNAPRIVLLEMQASINGGLAYKRDFDAIYEEVAEKYRLTLVPFIVTSIYLDAHYMLPDRIHMNKEGYAYVIENYLKKAVMDEIHKL